MNSALQYREVLRQERILSEHLMDDRSPSTLYLRSWGFHQPHHPAHLRRGRTDLFIEYFAPDGTRQPLVLELKILHRSLEATLAQGLQQTRAYMDRCGATEGHLLIFDRDPGRSWEEKIWERDVEGIRVWGA